MDANDILRCMEDSNSVLVTGIRHINGCRDDKLELHFGRRSNGGGDVHRIDLVDHDTAVITFEDEKVAVFIMGSSKHHAVADTRVSVESAHRKRQLLEGILATARASMTTTMDNGFAEQLSDQYRCRMNDDEDHYGHGDYSSSSWEQRSTFESQRTGSLSRDEAELGEYLTSFSLGNDTDSMEYETDECSETTGGTEVKTQRNASNQPTSIQCTEDVLNYIQAVHFSDVNRIQRKHKVTFEIKNQTTVILKSAAPGNVTYIQEAAKELRNLIKDVKSGTEKEIITLTPTEADSKNYAAMERDLVKSTSLMVTKGNGRTFVMYGTRSAIDDAKIKLKQMLGCSGNITSSTNAHPPGRHPQNEGRTTMNIAEQVKTSSSVSSKDQLPRIDKDKPLRSPTTMKQQEETRGAAFSNQPISIQGTEDVLNYIQAIHSGDLDSIQCKYKVTFDIKNRTTVLVKSAASGDVKYTLQAAKELSKLIKDVKSGTEKEIVTLTPDEADSKNYSAAERTLVKSTSLLVTKGNGKTFDMYGTRSAIDDAKIKLKQMLGCSSGNTSSANPSPNTPSKSSNSHRSSMTMKRNSQQQDTREVAKGTIFKPLEKQTPDGSTSSTPLPSPNQVVCSNPRQMVDSPASVKPKIRSRERHRIDYRRQDDEELHELIPAPIPHRHNSNSERIMIPRSPTRNIGYDDRGDTGFCDGIPDTVNVFETTIQGVKVIGRKSDIIDEFATVLVCSANNRLRCDHGLAARISQLGGHRVQSQCDNWITNHGYVRDGDVVWVDIDEGIACSHMINVVVPRWNGHGNGTEELLSKMFMNIFTAARDKLFAHSIALPLVGTECGIPRHVYARTFTGALLTFLAQPTVPVQEIRIVDWDEAGIHLIAKEIQENAHILQGYSMPQATIAPSGAMGPLYVKPTRPEAAASQADFQSFCDGGAMPRLRAPFIVADDEKCPVCWGHLRNKKTPINCSHACCGKCFRELEKSNKHCPVCRGPLR